jgi:hypothetical protein
MSATGAEDAVEQIRVDEALARRVVAEGGPALASFDVTEAEASALADALRLDVGDGFDAPPDDEVAGFGFGGLGAMPLDNLIGVGRQLGVQGVSEHGATGWIDVGSRSSGWIERPGTGGMVS